MFELNNASITLWSHTAKESLRALFQESQWARIKLLQYFLWAEPFNFCSISQECKARLY
jgi:hypothetical protein